MQPLPFFLRQSRFKFEVAGIRTQQWIWVHDAALRMANILQKAVSQQQTCVLPLIDTEVALEQNRIFSSRCR